MLSRRGIALPFVLLVITLMLIGVSVVTRQGLGALHQAKIEQFSKQAMMAAEAGASDALRRLVEDPSWLGPLPETSMDLGSKYSAQILNNFAVGGGTQFAANGAEVPEGHAYILASGTQGTISRQAGLLVSSGSSSAFGVAVGVGGDIDMSGSKRVAGTMKSSGSMRLSGSSRFEPFQGSGRLLAGGNIGASGSIRVDESQDVRARGSVPSNIRGAVLVQGGDSSEATLPFIADYRTTNILAPGEQGHILPNPDQAVLLAGVDLTVNQGITNLTSDLDLGGQVHYFPDGVTFSGSSRITGPGTIVSGNGNPMIFQGSTRALEGVNLIALRPPGVTTGLDPSIIFEGSTRVNGLIYAHEDVRIQGSFRLDGVIIAYQDGTGDLDTQGSTRITLDSTVFSNVPGFEPWVNGFGGIGGIPVGSDSLSVVSWERM